MSTRKEPVIAIEKYSEKDSTLLKKLLGDPIMMEHLGGPEKEDKIEERHLKYLNLSGCYTILYGHEKIAAGWIGYWAREWNNETIWETGWNVLPQFQRKGIATLATKMVLEKIKEEKDYRDIHAFPAIDNPPSNAICRKAGFTLVGEVEIEYPKGNLMKCNDWKYELL